jgi:hypothetical protein
VRRTARLSAGQWTASHRILRHSGSIARVVTDPAQRRPPPGRGGTPEERPRVPLHSPIGYAMALAGSDAPYSYSGSTAPSRDGEASRAQRPASAMPQRDDTAEADPAPPPSNWRDRRAGVGPVGCGARRESKRPRATCKTRLGCSRWTTITHAHLPSCSWPALVDGSDRGGVVDGTGPVTLEDHAAAGGHVVAGFECSPPGALRQRPGQHERPGRQR